MWSSICGAGSGSWSQATRRCVCHELGGPGLPDLGAVDDVARLALLAGRLGGRIVLSDVSPAMRSLLELAGLGVEVEGEAEGGEEPLGVEEGQEELHPGDLAS